MAELSQAKFDRTSGKKAFKRAKKALYTAISESAEEELVKSRYSDTKNSLAAAANLHDAYNRRLYGDDEVPEDADIYIEEIDAEFREIEQMTFKYFQNIRAEREKNLDTPLTGPVKQEEQGGQPEKAMVLNRVKNIRNLEGIALTSQIKEIKEMIEKKVGSSVMHELREELKLQWQKTKEAHRELVSNTTRGITEDDTRWINDLQKKYQESILSICDYIDKIKKNEEKIKRENDANKFRLERMKMPKFNGNIREYPKFKTDFNTHVLSQVSTSSAAYVLTTCLEGKPLEIAKTVDDDIETIWKRLDEIYGRPSKLIDVIMSEIKNFKPITDNDDKRLLDLINIVERGHRDLTRLGMEREISNASMVSLVEEKLPRLIKREWSKAVNEDRSIVEESNKFPYMLKFLQQQRRIVEYDSSELRAGNNQVKAATNHVEEATNHIQNENPGKRCLIHNTEKHETEQCRAYLALSTTEKVALLKSKRACWSCLKPSHRLVDCLNKRTCGTDGCNKNHHSSLHEAHGIVVHNITFSHEIEKPKSCMLQIMKINVHDNPVHHVNVLWDSGASLSLITFRKAKELCLIGTPVQLSIVKVGGATEASSSSVYTLPLVNKYGKVKNIRVYGIKEISSKIREIKVDDIIHLFSDLKKSEVKRPTGLIDVLVGFDYASLHPIREQSNGNLLLLSNSFGKCLGGTHPSVEEKTVTSLESMSIFHAGSVRIDEFFKTEEMGVACNPRCGGCKCGNCSPGSNDYSLKEERELRLIESNLEHKGDHWEARYPWIKDPWLLKDNRFAAEGMLRSTERRLLMNKTHADVYKAQIDDMVERGVARKLSKEELKEYQGPIHYLSHHEVIKENSLSTPCRIVFNSSRKHNGLSLNEFWAKGPDLINNQLGILIRFREFPYPVAGDIKKMYHTVKLKPGVDQHTHRFLWRNYEVMREPDIYVITSVSFGDRPSGAIATVALRKTAEMGQHEFPEAADVILKNTYVDDVLDSFCSEEDRLNVTRDIDDLLKPGGFEIKEWIMPNVSEDNLNQTNPVEQQIDQSTCGTPVDNITNPRVDEKDLKLNADWMVFDYNKVTRKSQSENQKVLGMKWTLGKDQDKFGFDVRLNFSPRKRKIRTGPDIVPTEISQQMPRRITKRQILSQINGVYDPLGLATPFTIRAKILMRDLWKSDVKDLGWDDTIPMEMYYKWVDFFKEMLKMKEVKFNRCLQPKGAVGNPCLVTFSDASEQAYGSVSYVRWQLQDGTFSSSLVAAKSKVAPLKSTSIVRLELNGAVIAKRLHTFIIKESRYSFEKEYLLVDSAIVRAMINKDSYGFKTYVALRVGEICQDTNPQNWYWINGELNIADWTTRGKDPTEIGPDSLWQRGPEFLTRPEKEWPIGKPLVDEVIPEQKQFVLNVEDSEEDILTNRIDIKRLPCFKRLIKVAARIIELYKRTPKLNLTQEDIKILRYVAVWTTRGKDPTEIGPDILCQRDPEFIPEQKQSVLNVEASEKDTLANRIDIKRFSCFKHLIRVTARILQLYKRTPKLNLTQEDIQRAERFWVLEAQLGMQDDVKKGKYKRLCARVREDNIIVVGERAKKGFVSYNSEEIPLLPYHHPLSRLYALFVHNISHLGVTATVSKIRNKYWITKVQKIVKSIRAHCIVCRKNAKLMATQVMAPLPSIRLNPSPPWYNSGVDLFGPYTIRGEVNKRSRGKAYGIIFTCMTTRAVHIDVATDYSTQGFLMVFRRFVSLRGYPATMFSDMGSQLKAADKELKDIVKGWDHDELCQYGAHEGLEWKFCAPDAPWQNGCTEALVKSVKKSINHAIGIQVLSFSELQTVCFECGNLVNERPIGAQPKHPEDGFYLCPNDMLLGRSSNRVPSGPFREATTPKQRVELVQNMVNTFWKKWIRDYFPSLLIRQKWHVQKRNIRIGDVVMIQDSGAIRGSWRLGVIKNVILGDDQSVRRVEVAYKNILPNEKPEDYHGKPYTIVQRPVQRLVVLLPIEEQQ